jgi:PPOX class probable F420-dependent enzyme
VKLPVDVRKFLEGVHFAVLGTVNADGSPQQTVMWYQLRGDEIMMNTLRGRLKDRNLARDPRASVCVEDHYDYVTLAGTIRMIDDPGTTQADIHALATRYHGPERAGRMMRESFSRQQRVTLLMTVDAIDVHGFGNEE